MHRRIYNRHQEKQKKMSSSTNLDWGMPQVRPLTMQLKTISRLPDLKTSLSQAETLWSSSR